MWLTESVRSPKKRGGKHEGFYNFDLLELIGVPAPAKLQPWLAPDEAAKERLAKKLPQGVAAGGYAVLHVGAHAGKPRLALEFFSAAARWLVKERGLRVLLIGAEPGDDLVGKILADVAEAKAFLHDFCGQTDLAEAAFLLRDAAVVFGRDSGPAHLAAAMGARTVTLMLEPERENSAQRWRPLGEHSWVLEKPMERRWLESRACFARRNLAQYQLAEIEDALKTALGQ
jgi:ADP-heptose:LPS heptosyltransferase